MTRTSTWVVDITHFLDARGRLPRDARPLMRYMTEIVALASALVPNQVRIIPLRCRRRPGRRPCEGHLHAKLEGESGGIIWECSGCGDRGLISNWQDTAWDNSRSVDMGPATNTMVGLSGFSAPALRAWDTLAAETRIRILNNVWCGGCRAGTSIALESARVSGSDLVLRGRCTKCGESVVRVVEEVCTS